MPLGHHGRGNHPVFSSYQRLITQISVLSLATGYRLAVHMLEDFLLSFQWIVWVEGKRMAAGNNTDNEGV